MIPARLVVDELRVSFVAISAEPSSYVPLSPRYLRAEPSVASAPVTVGPLPASSPGRAALGRGWGISPEGIPFSPLGQRFDFGFYDVAPLAQQVEAIRSNARIRLHNLQEGESRRDVVLPGLEPLVFLAGGGAARREVRMRCDTLSVDTEHARLTLTWRGHVSPFDAHDATARLVVTSRKQGEVVPFEKLALAIASARPVPAVEAAHVRAAWDAAARAPAPAAQPAIEDDDPVITPLRPTEPEEEDEPVVTPLRPGPPARAQTLVSASLLSPPVAQMARRARRESPSSVEEPPAPRPSAPERWATDSSRPWRRRPSSWPRPPPAFVRKEPAAPHPTMPPAAVAAAPRAGLGGMRLSMGFRLAQSRSLGRGRRRAWSRSPSCAASPTKSPR